MKAIDTHVHPGTKEDTIDCGGKYIEHALRYFGQKVEFLTEEALAERYQSGYYGHPSRLGCGNQHGVEAALQ